MLASDFAIVLSAVTIAAASGCNISPDMVKDGVYGGEAVPAGTGTAPPRGLVQGGVSQPAAGAGATATPSAGTAAPPTNNTGTGMGAVGVGGSPGIQASAGSTGTPPTAAAGGAAQPMTGAAGEGGITQPPAAAGPCDMTGRWLSTLHLVTDALGQLQYVHTYVYYELEQTGSTISVKKALHCGDDGVGTGDFAATVDFSASWASVIPRVSYVGRMGTSEEVAGGCQVAFDKWYVVRGATLPYYLDPSTTMPEAETPAMGDTPGWEDWDNDGNPGVTGTISGVVSGKIFCAPRQWTQISGTAADVSSVFRLEVMWDQEQGVMAVDGSPLLSSQAVRAADAKLHFTQFARLQPDQGVGADDAAICASVVALAPTLTPEAAGN
jgi:hypothetical protein